MTQSVNSIIDAALALTSQERAEIATRLIRSLHGPVPSAAEQADIDAAWAEEIERRVSDLDAGKTQTVPYHQAMQQIREELKRGSQT